jgi:hypothetical protein
MPLECHHVCWFAFLASEEAMKLVRQENDERLTSFFIPPLDHPLPVQQNASRPLRPGWGESVSRS